MRHKTFSGKLMCFAVVLGLFFSVAPIANADDAPFVFGQEKFDTIEAAVGTRPARKISGR